MKLSPIIVSQLIDVSAQAVRIGMQRGIFDFGAAIFITGRYTYDIRPKKVADYLGISVEELEEKVKSIA